MATFLQLVQAVGSDSGSASGTLATVTGATGRWATIVRFVSQAWENIQKDRNDWTFRRKAFSSSLAAGTATYAASAFSITDFGGWLRERDGFEPITIYDPALGQGDETQVCQIKHDQYLMSYDRGSHDQNRPLHVARTPDRGLSFGPTPDKVYTVRGWYKREVQVLADDADVPYIDDEFHDVIKWRAMVMLAEYDEAAFPIGTAVSNYRNLYGTFLHEYLPEVELA